MPLAHEGAAPVPPEVTGCPAVTGMHSHPGVTLAPACASPPPNNSRPTRPTNTTKEQTNTSPTVLRISASFMTIRGAGPIVTGPPPDDPGSPGPPIVAQGPESKLGHPADRVSGSFSAIRGLNFAGRRQPRGIGWSRCTRFFARCVSSRLPTPTTRPGLHAPFSKSTVRAISGSVCGVNRSSTRRADDATAQQRGARTIPRKARLSNKLRRRRHLPRPWLTTPHRPERRHSPTSLAASRHCALCVHVRHSARAPQKETLFGSHMHSPIT